MFVAVLLVVSRQSLLSAQSDAPITGDNLLLNGDGAELKEGLPAAWQPSSLRDSGTYPAFSVTPVGTGNALTISSQVAYDDAWYTQWIDLSDEDYVGIYRVRARARLAGPDVKARIAVYGTLPNALRHFAEASVPAGDADWIDVSKTFYFGPSTYTPAPKPKMQVALILSSPGRVDFNDVILVRVKPRITQINERVTQEFYGPNHVILDIDDGSHRVRLIPQRPQHRPKPTPSAQHKAWGFIRFVPPNNAGVLPSYVPSSDEVATKPMRFAARGESEFVTFCIRPLSDMGVVSFDLTDLVGPDGARIDSRSCEIYMPVCPTAEMIGYNARATDARYQWMNKWLRPMTTYKAPQRENIQLYIDVNVPPDARAGSYHGQVNLTSEKGASAAIPFEIEVLPISLERSMPWGFFRYGWHIDNDAARADYLRGLREMRWAGMTQATISWQDGISIGKDGTVDMSGYDRRVALYKEAGFTDPPVIGMERMFPSICAAIGNRDLAFDAHGFARFKEQDIPDDVRAFAAKVIRNIYDHSVQANWGPYSLHLVDEISPGGKTVVARFIYPLWREVAPKARLHSGIYTFDWWKQYDGPLDINTVHYVHPCHNEQGNRRWRAMAKERGTDTLFGIDFIGGLNTFWEGRQITLTCAKGVDGVMCWTQWVDNHVEHYEANHNFDLDDFDPYLFTYSYWKGGPWAVHLRDGKTMRSTGWFGIREGIDDSRYLNTARAWINKARASADAVIKQDARAAALRLENAMAAVPWLAELRHPKSTWSSDSADKVRRICADITVYLQNALAE